jgi:hypothetical protein
MKWLEVIKISVAENRRTAMEEQITSLMSDLKREKNETIKLYQNLQDGEFSIHLCWENGKAAPRGSATGLCLAHLLKGFGLISHTVWAEKQYE